MILRRFILRAALGLAAFSAQLPKLSAQASTDVAPPKAREKVMADAAIVLAKSGDFVAPPSPMPNPFVAKDDGENAATEHAPATAAAGPARAAPAHSGGAQLSQLAALIPATGVITVGGSSMLLTGTKRLKIGDACTVTFEGQAYDLTLTAISSTSFTVKRGDSLHTRPVRQSAP
jgi:hypothetical protein